MWEHDSVSSSLSRLYSCSDAYNMHMYMYTYQHVIFTHMHAFNFNHGEPHLQSVKCHLPTENVHVFMNEKTVAGIASLYTSHCSNISMTKQLSKASAKATKMWNKCQ